MHEMAVASNILEMIEQEMTRHSESTLLGFELEVGELSCVQEHSLSFCLEACLNQTPWPKAQIQITTKSPLVLCRPCDKTFTGDRYTFACPHCGKSEIDVVEGREVRLVSLEIDE